MTTYYAYSPSMDAGTGSLLYDSATLSWTEGQPMMQTVLVTLRTPKGRCPMDPTLGPDYAILQKATPDIAARWRASVIESLQRYVRAGQIADLSVTVDLSGGSAGVSAAWLYSVSFSDPREPSATKRKSTGMLTAAVG